MDEVFGFGASRSIVVHCRCLSLLEASISSECGNAIQLLDKALDTAILGRFGAAGWQRPGREQRVADGCSKISQVSPQIGQTLRGLLAGYGYATEPIPGTSLGIDDQGGHNGETAV